MYFSRETFLVFTFEMIDQSNYLTFIQIILRLDVEIKNPAIVLQ